MKLATLLKCYPLIAEEIYLFLWKFDIDKVNAEYSGKFHDGGGNLVMKLTDNLRVQIGWQKYADQPEGTHFLNFFDNIGRRFALPSKYFYSSGLNHPSGYCEPW